MGFPEYPRVIYEKNPLDTVICQLRFPPVLRIESEVPAAFQERIRHEFPLYTEKTSVSIPSEVPQEIGRLLTSELGRKAYDFASADGQWVVSLTSEYLALTARRYRQWEEFREKLSVPAQAVREVYQPAFYSRLGLRYQDVIVPSLLGLEGAAWSELLSPTILAELGSELGPRVRQARHDVLIALDEFDGRVRVRHGLARHARAPAQESCYVIDADFFTARRTEIGDASTVLDDFSRQAGRFFRWCITDRLHHAMGPRPVS